MLSALTWPIKIHSSPGKATNITQVIKKGIRQQCKGWKERHSMLKLFNINFYDFYKIPRDFFIDFAKFSENLLHISKALSLFYIPI